MDAEGNFVIAWQNHNLGTLPYPDGEPGTAILAALFHKDGTKTLGDFVVNSSAEGHQTHPAAAMAPDGAFAIAWTDEEGFDGDLSGVFVQAYNAGGSSNGSEIQVNSSTTGHQWFSAIAMNADGSFTVVWFGPDEDDNGVFGQRFAT